MSEVSHSTILGRIAQELELELQHLSNEEAQEVCFNEVKTLCYGSNWTKIETLREPISQLVDSIGQTILSVCIKEREQTAFKKLLDLSIAVHTPSKNGNLPIHVATEEGLLDFITDLFFHNNLSSKNSLGQTPLHLAAYKGHSEVIKYLLNNSPPMARILPAKWVYGSSTFDLCPVELTIMQGHRQCLDLFLDNPSIEKEITRSSIGNFLHLAIFFHQNTILERLLTLYHARFLPQIEERNASKQTPLMLAAHMGNEEALLLLIAKGAKIDTVDAEGNTAAHWAVLGRQTNALTLLAKSNADLRIENFNHQDPARLARETLRDSISNYLTNLKSHNKNLLGHQSSKPKYIAFRGGGIKGLALGGVVKGLEKLGVSDSIKYVAGTSAGAMMAGLYAVGFKSNRIIDIFKTINFMDLLDHPGEEIMDAVKHPTFKHTFQLLKTIASAVKNPVETALTIISQTVEKLWHTTGICKGEAARKLVEKYLLEATGIPFFTFGELREGINQGKPYRHLHVFATKIGPNQEILDINSEDPIWDSIIISDAVRGSMGIPGAYEAHRLHMKVSSPGKDPIRVPIPENYVLVDGGMLYNLGIERFDRKCYVSSNYTESDKNYPTFNPNAIGISLCDPSEQLSRPDEAGNKNILDFLKNITSIYFEAESLIRSTNPYHKTRLAEISTCGIGTLKFNLSDEEKNLLINSGERGIEQFFREKTNHFESIQNPPAPQALIPNRPAEPAQITQSQVPTHKIGSQVGLYVLGICQNNACRDVSKEQWRLISSPEKKAKTINIGKSISTLKCPCCKDTFKGIEKAALSGCSGELEYGDNAGLQARQLKATPGQAEIIKWGGTIRLIEIKI